MLVSVQSVLWQTEKLSHHKTAKVLVVTFSGAVNAGDVQDPGAYHLLAAGKDKKFGTNTVKLTAATYDPRAHTVTLTTKGKVPNKPLQLTINAALVLDAQGQQLDGNRDGQPGGNFVATLGKKGISLASTSPSGAVSGVEVQRFDGLG